jgi:hypothetical protein
MGSGKMTKTPQQASLFAVENENLIETSANLTSEAQIESHKPKLEPVAKKESVLNIVQENKEIQNTKKIEKIVILYSDQSFKEYVSSK